MSPRTKVEIEDGIAWITLDDGKVNVFSEGFDLSTFKRGPDATVEMLRAGAELYRRLLAFPLPVLTVPKFALELARHRLTPSGFARITTAPMFEPEEAMRLGYLDRVVQADQLAAAAQEEAVRLRALDMPSFEATKARINERALQLIRAAVSEELRTAPR